jgi:hypothetical protein
MHHHSIESIKRANREAGLNWFAPDSMRFFGSRILSGVYSGRFFVTSERCRWGDHDRLYSVRVACPDGSIDTVGAFQAYRTARQAKAAARKLATSEDQS